MDEHTFDYSEIGGERERVVAGVLRPLLLTWFNFNPSMDK